MFFRNTTRSKIGNTFSGKFTFDPSPSRPCPHHIISVSYSYNTWRFLVITFDFHHYLRWRSAFLSTSYYIKANANILECSTMTYVPKIGKLYFHYKYYKYLLVRLPIVIDRHHDLRRRSVKPAHVMILIIQFPLMKRAPLFFTRITFRIPPSSIKCALQHDEERRRPR